MRAEVIDLPFGADRDPVVLETIREHWQGSPTGTPAGAQPLAVEAGVIRNPLARQIVYVAESRARSQVIQQKLMEMIGLVPPGWYGAVDGVVIKFAVDRFPGLSFPGSVESRALTQAALEDAAQELVPAEGGVSYAGSRAARIIGRALSRTRVVLPPDRRGLLENPPDWLPAEIATRLRIVGGTLSRMDRRLRDAMQCDADDAEWRMLEGIERAAGDIGLLLIDDPYRLGPAQVQWLSTLADAVQLAGGRVVWIRRGTECVHVPHGLVLQELVKLASSAGAVNQTSVTRGQLLAALSPEASLEVQDAVADLPRIACFATVEQEARTVVARAKALHVLGGVPLSQIGIALVDRDREDLLIRELEDAGLPHARSRPLRANLSPAIQAIAGLLQAAADGFPTEQTCAVLRSIWLAGLARVLSDLRAEVVAEPDELEALDPVAEQPELVEEPPAPDSDEEAGRAALVDAIHPGSNEAQLDEREIVRENIGKWRSRWLSSVGRLLSAFRRYNHTGGAPGETASLAWGPVFEAEPELAAEWSSVVEMLDGLSRANSPQQMAAALLKLLEASAAEAVADHRRTARRASGTPHPEYARAVWTSNCLRRLNRMLQEYVASPVSHSTGPERAALELLEAIGELAVFVPPPKESVRLLGLLDARGIQVSHLFVVGLRDGKLPFPDPDNLFLPKRLRALADTAEREGRADAEQAQVLRMLSGDASPIPVYRHLLACALSNGARELTLSWAAMVDGEPGGPSLPLRDVMAAICRLNGGDARFLTEKEAVAEAKALAANPAIGVAGSAVALPHSQPAWQRLMAAGTAEQMRPGLEGSAGATATTSADREPDAVWQALHGARIGLARDDAAAFVDAAAAGVAGTVPPAHAVYDGMLTQGPAALAQPARRAGLVDVSPSGLQDYASCPALYLWKNSIRVREPERADGSLSQLDRGTWIHEILEHSMVAIRDALAEAVTHRPELIGDILIRAGAGLGPVLESADRSRHRGDPAEETPAPVWPGMRHPRDIPDPSTLPLVDFAAFDRLADGLTKLAPNNSLTPTLEAVRGWAVGLATDLSTRSATALLIAEVVSGMTDRSRSVEWQQWVRENARGLAEAAAPLMARRSDPEAPWIPGAPGLVGLLARLEQLQQGDGFRVYPWLLEYSFGYGSTGAFRLEDSAGRPMVELSGKADLLCAVVQPDGSFDGIVVVDLKSGDVSSYGRGLQSGRTFQLPLYTMAAQHLLAGSSTGRPVAGDSKLRAAGFFYLSAKRSKTGVADIGGIAATPSLHQMLGDKKSAFGSPEWRVLSTVADRLGGVLNSLEAGQFHNALVDGTEPCKYCSYRLACAVRERKQEFISSTEPSARQQRGLYSPDPLPLGQGAKQAAGLESPMGEIE